MNHNYGSDWPAFIIEAGVFLGTLVLIYGVLVFLPGK